MKMAKTNYNLKHNRNLQEGKIVLIFLLHIMGSPCTYFPCLCLFNRYLSASLCSRYYFHNTYILMRWNSDNMQVSLPPPLSPPPPKEIQIAFCSLGLGEGIVIVKLGVE